MCFGGFSGVEIWLGLGDRLVEGPSAGRGLCSLQSVGILGGMALSTARSSTCAGKDHYFLTVGNFLGFILQALLPS